MPKIIQKNRSHHAGDNKLKLSKIFSKCFQMVLNGSWVSDTDSMFGLLVDDRFEVGVVGGEKP